MTEQAHTPGPPVPSKPEQWDRISEIKLKVIQKDPLLLDPDDYPEVRREVLLSWKRSLLAGVDTWSTAIPFDEDFTPKSRLAQVAQPIMNRLEDQISDLSSWGFLTDRACRLLTAVVGDSPQAKRMRQVDLRPGLCFAEDQIGTNGIGCAQEQQQSFIISGTEHFRMNTGIITTTGVNIRDPYTKRFVGTLGVHCRREYGSTALLPLVAEIGRSIETQLLASRADGERVFFDFFLRTQRRFRGAVVGITKSLFITNTQSRELVGEADEDLLRRLAEEACARSKPRTVRRRLSSGIVASVQISPVEQARGDFAAVLTLELETAHQSVHFDQGDRDLAEQDRPDARRQLGQALAAGHAVLLTGERGTGKRFIGSEALRRKSPRSEVAEIDGSVAHLDEDRWLKALQQAVEDAGSIVLLSHIEEIPLRLMTTVSDLVARATCALVGTTSEQVDDDSPSVFVRESFPVVVPVPPLRDRAHEFSELCRDILRELEGSDGRATSLASKSVAALVASDWPGNIRQLRQVLATSRIRAAGREIKQADLPARYGSGQASRFFGEMERVERQTLMVALRDADGNRNVAAERLGMSRATIYRKLKRYELH
ncbi:transcriptional regulator of acetoin/glycerol metabolism [Arthrobacter globiformis]|uniref:helix-turn-helix domain-containing protein n=1 Tax=Arthrobacter globiformis TaxID=1665 RepID=UPI0027875040|nr:helix-turn-helix domain-containing protein [Arthrobacter globiformis]MDQ1058093.1 transcriptional regulator of acetoin/glycerol metabolism [Arthrobacter globiformis]